MDIWHSSSDSTGDSPILLQKPGFNLQLCSGFQHRTDTHSGGKGVSGATATIQVIGSLPAEWEACWLQPSPSVVDIWVVNLQAKDSLWFSLLSLFQTNNVN